MNTVGQTGAASGSGVTSASTGPGDLPASFFRPRLKRATMTYGGKRRSSVSASKQLKPLLRDDGAEIKESDAKRVKRKKPEFQVAHDDFAVDIQAFSELAVSKRPSGGTALTAGGTLALRDKSNALFLPKLELSNKPSPPTNHIPSGPTEPVSTLISFAPPNLPLAPRSPHRDRSSFTTYQSTPGRNASSSVSLPSPGLASGIFDNLQTDHSDSTMKESVGPSRKALSATVEGRQPAHDGTTSAEEDDDNDRALAGLLKGSLAIKETRSPLGPSSSASFLSAAPLAMTAMQVKRSESELDALASDEAPSWRPAVAAQRAEKHRKKKAAAKLPVAGSGALKPSRKASSKDANLSSSGSGDSARRKRSSTAPVASRGPEGKLKRGVKGSIIRDVAVRAESSASADEIGF